MEKEKRQIILLIFIILFGICYAYFKFLFLPQWSVVKSELNNLTALQNHYEELLTYQKNRTDLEETIAGLTKQALQLKNQLPSRLDKPQLMVGLYALAKQHAVAPQSIAFEQVQAKGTYQELGMNFSCTGKAADLLAMIHDLQFGESQRLAVKSINLTGSQESMRAELKLTAAASLNIANTSEQKPAFMNSQFGMSSSAAMFQP